MQLISGIVRYKSKVNSKNCFFEKRKTIWVWRPNCLKTI